MVAEEIKLNICFDAKLEYDFQISVGLGMGGKKVRKIAAEQLFTVPSLPLQQKWALKKGNQSSLLNLSIFEVPGLSAGLTSHSKWRLKWSC